MRHFVACSLVGSLAAVAACSDTSGPGSDGSLTHPAGTIAASTDLAFRPYAVAITPSGRVFVGQLDNARLASGVLPATSFSQSFAVGTVPTDIALDPAGTEAFVANQFDDRVQRLNASTGESVGTIRVTGDPFSVAVAEGASAIYVTTNADSVYRVDPVTSGITARRATDGAAAQSLAIDRKTGLVYVSTRDGGTVLELNPSDLSLVRRFSPGGRTQEVAVTSDSRELWIANEYGFVTVVTLATGSMTSISVPGAAWGLAITPDNEQVWVGLLDAGSVKVIDRSSREVIGSIRTGGVPRRIRFTARGDQAVIANESNWVDVVK